MNDTVDRSQLNWADRAKYKWLCEHPRHLAVLSVISETGYMARGQVIELFGGSGPAIRAIHQLQEANLVGSVSFHGRQVLYLRPRGARVISGSPDAEGVRRRPDDEDIAVAIARVEWGMRTKSRTVLGATRLSLEPLEEANSVRSASMSARQELHAAAVAEHAARVAFETGLGTRDVADQAREALARAQEKAITLPEAADWPVYDVEGFTRRTAHYRKSVYWFAVELDPVTRGVELACAVVDLPMMSLDACITRVGTIRAHARTLYPQARLHLDVIDIGAGYGSTLTHSMEYIFRWLQWHYERVDDLLTWDGGTVRFHSFGLERYLVSPHRKDTY